MTHRSQLPPPTPSSEVHKIVIDICEQRGERKHIKRGNAGKLFTRWKVLPLIMYWSNSTWIWTLPGSNTTEWNRQSARNRKNVPWFSVIDSFFGESKRLVGLLAKWKRLSWTTNVRGAGAIESLAPLHHESGYSAFVLHSLSKTTRKQQQSLLPEYERINLLPMLNIYLSLFFVRSLASFIRK